MVSANGFRYDTLDRLTEADYLVGVLTEDEQFTYDSLGNRTNVNLRNGSDEVYSLANPNLNNQYTAIGGISLTHDTAGNMTECNLDYTYEYDYENRLNKITKNSSTKAEYTYDALGRRIEKIADGVTTRYYYDGWRVLTETDENEAVQREYVYGNYLDEVLIKVEDNEDIYYAHDHLFSVVALIDDEGDVIERYEYDAYGHCTFLAADFSQLANQQSAYDNTRLFTGKPLDILDNGNNRKQYNNNRVYDPPTGRWLQREPLGVRDGICLVNFRVTGSPLFHRQFCVNKQYKDSMNLHEYSLSNPIIFVDPSGEVVVIVVSTTIYAKAAYHGILACYCCWELKECLGRAQDQALWFTKRINEQLDSAEDDEEMERTMKNYTKSMKSGFGRECVELAKCCGLNAIKFGFWLGGRHFAIKYVVK